MHHGLHEFIANFQLYRGLRQGGTVTLISESATNRNLHQFDSEFAHDLQQE